MTADATPLATSDAPACPIPARRARAWTRAELVEGVLIAATVALAVLLAGTRAWSVPLGRAIAWSGAVVLGQGLLRDLARLATRRAPSAGRQRLRCLCAESAFGPALVAGGIGLLFLGVDAPVTLDRGRLGLGLAVLLGLGFAAKDWVLVLRRVEDHAGIDVA